ncbi:signal peptidase I [bacterium D16-51]|nr:signal peptidase I [bacterium D16-59]RKI61757.1 signal peptidase I [bacterium D16-51]
MKYDFDLENRKEARKHLVKMILITLVEVLVVVFAAFAITHYGMETFTVSGQYMSPTLENGDKILVNKLSFHIHSIKRNDVVIVQQSGSEHNYYTVERVIGLPGEEVQIREGRVYINGKKLKESYDFPKMENGGLAMEPVILEDEEYFVLCDNRNNGEDSRNANVGNIAEEDIVGKAWVRMNTIEFISHLDGFSKEKESPKPDAETASPAAKKE